MKNDYCIFLCQVLFTIQEGLQMPQKREHRVNSDSAGQGGDILEHRSSLSLNPSPGAHGYTNG